MTWTDGAAAEDDQVPRGTGAEPERLAPPAGGLLPLVGWLLAAGLAAGAPFLDVARVVFETPSRRDDRTISIDGWGRASPAESFAPGHGPQFGILLWVCAAALAVAALLLLVRRRSGVSGDYAPPHPLGLLSVGAPAALAAAAAAVYLSADSLVDQARGAASHGESGFGVRADYGWGVWLVVAAAVCAAVATALYLGSERADEYADDPEDLTA